MTGTTSSPITGSWFRFPLRGLGTGNHSQNQFREPIGNHSGTGNHFSSKVAFPQQTAAPERAPRASRTTRPHRPPRPGDPDEREQRLTDRGVPTTTAHHRRMKETKGG